MTTRISLDDQTHREIFDLFARYPGKEGQVAAELVTQGVCDRKTAEDLLFAALMRNLGIPVRWGKAP